MELHTLPYVVVDVETTGGQPSGTDRVTEVARMLGGDPASKVSRAHARELLEAAG